MNMKKITYIIPCYNESEVIYEFYKRLKRLSEELRSYEFEFLFVNDGSNDGTAEILNALSEQDNRLKVLHLAKNRGHQMALTAGMDFAGGDIIVTIDADLQDPPELVKEMLYKIQLGYEIVHAQRRKRAGETWFKLFTAWVFYKLMSKFLVKDLIENCGDFRAFTRPVLEAVCHFRERHRFLRGTFAIIGFKQCIVTYDRDIRYAGKTKYPFNKMFSLAINAILSFSSSPIKVIIWVSLMLWSSSLIYLGKALIDHFIFHVTVEGWTSIIILLTFFTGINLFSLGIIGSYVGRIFEQGQKRPLYWLYDTRNIDIGNFNKYCTLDIEEVTLSKNILSKYDVYKPSYTKTGRPMHAD